MNVRACRHAAKQTCASFNKAVRRLPEITTLGTSSVRRHTELDVENHIQFI